MQGVLTKWSLNAKISKLEENEKQAGDHIGRNGELLQQVSRLHNENAEYRETMADALTNLKAAISRFISRFESEHAARKSLRTEILEYTDGIDLEFI